MFYSAKTFMQPSPNGTGDFSQPFIIPSLHNYAAHLPQRDENNSTC